MGKDRFELVLIEPVAKRVGHSYYRAPLAAGNCERVRDLALYDRDPRLAKICESAESIHRLVQAGRLLRSDHSCASQPQRKMRACEERADCE